MTAGEWNDLERLWQSLPPQAAPAVDELKRQQKWRWFSGLVVAMEIATAIAGATAGVWMLALGDLTWAVLGVATLIFVAAVSGASLWARSIATARADDPVMQAVEMAVRRAQLGVRLAIAALWSVCASLVFLAIFAFVVDFEAAAPPSPQMSAFSAIAIALIWLAALLAGAILYLRKRSTDLSRLQVLKSSLAQEI